MALALSLTRIFKGRDIQGEVGTNPHMRRLGLECPAREGCAEPEERKCGSCKAGDVCSLKAAAAGRDTTSVGDAASAAR